MRIFHIYDGSRFHGSTQATDLVDAQEEVDRSCPGMTAVDPHRAKPRPVVRIDVRHPDEMVDK